MEKFKIIENGNSKCLEIASSNKTIWLASCVSQKLKGTHKAKDIYISSLFKKTRKLIEKSMKPNDSWWILSAKHKLLNVENEIEYYDETLNNMTSKEKKDWANAVFKQFKEIYKKPANVVFLAGKNYSTHLAELLKKEGHNCIFPMEGMKIGERLQWLG